MNTISGLSFYDSLNKLSVGMLLLFLIPSLGEAISSPFFYIIAFIIGCVYQAIIRRLTAYWTLKECELKKTCGNGNIVKKGNLKETYLKAYYKVAKAGLLMNIPILEALENFMRNLLFIILLYLIFIGFGHNPFSAIWEQNNTIHHCGYVVIFILLIPITIRLRYYYQFEIYRLIWEAYDYLKNIECEEK